MAEFEMTISGLSELDKNLEELAGPLSEKIIRKALRSGGQIMQAAIIANAPVDPKIRAPKGTPLPPGALKSDVHLTVSKNKGIEDSFTAWIYFGRWTEHCARWVEWGHRQVVGRTSKKRGTTARQIGDVPAHPFIRPAFEGNIDLVANAIGRSIADDINTPKKLGA